MTLPRIDYDHEANSLVEDKKVLSTHVPLFCLHYTVLQEIKYYVGRIGYSNHAAKSTQTSVWMAQHTTESR